jgi:hypothetical protein
LRTKIVSLPVRLVVACWLLVDVLVRDVETVMAYEPEVTAKRVLAAMTQYLRPIT